MRIAIDLSPLSHSAHRGIGAYARALIQALERVAPQHEYVLFIPAGLQDIDPFKKHSVVRLPQPPLGRVSALLTSQLVLPYLLIREKVDLLHVLDVPFNPSHPSAAALKLRPLVITLHDLTPLYSPVVLNTWRYRLFYRFSMWLARRADALVVDSETSRRDALHARIARRKKVFVAPLAAVVEPTESQRDAANIQPSQELPRTNYILHVGSTDWNKNREGVLKAFEILAASGDVSLVLVGGEDSWKSVLSQDLHSRVFHYPHIDRGSLNRLYAHASAFVFPSRYEGFGLPILEAMQAGVPVVTSDRGAMKEVAGSAALLVDPESPQSIAGATQRLLQDAPLATRLGTLGRERAATFSWDTTARITLEAYAYAIRASQRSSA